MIAISPLNHWDYRINGKSIQIGGCSTEDKIKQDQYARRLGGLSDINEIEGFSGLSKTNMHAYKGIRKKNWEYYLKEMEFQV